MNIRLESWEINEITKSFKECFEDKDCLWLFGSRVDLRKYGGDIDLYVEIADFNSEKVFNQEQNFWILLQERLGEQKIDIVVRDPRKELSIYQVARQEGIKIV